MRPAREIFGSTLEIARRGSAVCLYVGGYVCLCTNTYVCGSNGWPEFVFSVCVTLSMLKNDEFISLQC